MHVLARATAGLCTALALAAAVATSAAATVSPTLAESGSTLAVEQFGIAMSTEGERSALAYAGVVTGSRRREMKLRARVGRGRTFGASRLLESLRRASGTRAQISITDLKVAVSPDGRAVAAWIATTFSSDFSHARRRLRVAAAAPRGQFGAARTVLTTARPLDIDALVAGRGGLIVLALQRSDAVEVLVLRDGGRFRAPQRIGTSTIFAAPPTLALASRGLVVAAWSPAFDSAAQAAVLPTGGLRFLGARPVSPPGQPTSYARAVAGPGGAGVVWSSGSSSGPPSATGSVGFARLRRDASALAAPETVAAVRISGAPSGAITRRGLATVWRHYIDETVPGDSDFFVNSRVAATASWTGDVAPRRLSEPPASAFRPVIAALGDRALVAWREAPAYALGFAIRLAVAGPDGWLPTVDLRPGGGSDVQTRPSTGISDDERPSGADLQITAGRDGALLAWLTSTTTSDGERVGRLRVASYRP